MNARSVWTGAPGPHRRLGGTMMLLSLTLALCVGCSGADNAGGPPATAPISPDSSVAPSAGPTTASPSAVTPSARPNGRSSASSSATTTTTTTPTPTPTVTPTRSPSSAPPSPSSGSADPGAASTGSAQPAPDPTASGPVQPVGRPGASAKRVEAGAGVFGRQLSWADDVRIEVVSTASAITTADGAGQTAGLAVTRFTVVITNDSEADVDATSVVATCVYGTTTTRLAGAVYDESSADFATVITPGTSAQAVYVFAVPAPSRGAVSLTVDLDGSHQPAVITGSVA